MKTIKWVALICLMVFALLFKDKIEAVNPWGMYLGQYKGVFPGILIAITIAVLYFLITLTSWDGNFSELLWRTLSVMVFANWFTIYVLGLLALFMGIAMARSGVIYNPIFSPVEIGEVQDEPLMKRTKAGAIIGYRVMSILEDSDGNKKLYPATPTGEYYGGDVWNNSEVVSHRVPTPDNTAGLYFCYNSDDPQLKYVKEHGRNAALFEVEFYGTVVAHETGGRAEKAHIRRRID